MSRLRDRLSYANVTATLALFIALGGTSYAAVTLPRNSVGSAQLRSNAVSSAEIRDRSIRLRDVSPTTRRQLQGQAGPQGPVGETGPAGISAVRYFAAVTSAGGFARGNALSGGRAGGPGRYTVGFGVSVSGCAYAATVGSTDASSVGAARATVSDQGGVVGVQTYDAGGAPADLPFHLLVVC